MASNLETTKKAYELFKQGDILTLVKRHYRRNMYVDITWPSGQIALGGQVQGAARDCRFLRGSRSEFGFC
jgi:hypothetical protein